MYLEKVKNNKMTQINVNKLPCKVTVKGLINANTDELKSFLRVIGHEFYDFMKNIIKSVP